MGVQSPDPLKSRYPHFFFFFFGWVSSFLLFPPGACGQHVPSREAGTLCPFATQSLSPASQIVCGTRLLFKVAHQQRSRCNKLGKGKQGLSLQVWALKNSKKDGLLFSQTGLPWPGAMVLFRTSCGPSLPAPEAKGFFVLEPSPGKQVLQVGPSPPAQGDEGAAWFIQCPSFPDLLRTQEEARVEPT